MQIYIFFKILPLFVWSSRSMFCFCLKKKCCPSYSSWWNIHRLYWTLSFECTILSITPFSRNTCYWLIHHISQSTNKKNKWDFLKDKYCLVLTLPLQQLHNVHHGNGSHWRKSYLPKTFKFIKGSYCQHFMTASEILRKLSLMGAYEFKQNFF